MATKKEIVAELKTLGIEADESTPKIELESLLAELKGGTEVSSDDEDSDTPAADEGASGDGSGGPVRKQGHAADLSNLPADIEIPEHRKPKVSQGSNDGRKLAGRYELICKCHVRGTILPPGTKLDLGEEDARRLLNQQAVKPV